MAEKKKWIASATDDAHGQFKKKAKEAGKSTEEFARMHEHSPGKLGKQARLALTLMGLKHTSKTEHQASKLYDKKS